jgi:hypothetical protein
MRKHRQHFREGRNIVFYNFIRSNGFDITDFEMNVVATAENRAEAFKIESDRIKETKNMNLNCHIRKMPEGFSKTISKSLMGNSRRLGTKTSLEGRNNMSKAQLRIKNVTCPHCGKEGKPSIMSRWHFDRCKLK